MGEKKYNLLRPTIIISIALSIVVLEINGAI